MLLIERRVDTFLCPCGHTIEGVVSFSVATLVLLAVVSAESVRGSCDHCARSLFAEYVRMKLFACTMASISFSICALGPSPLVKERDQ